MYTVDGEKGKNGVVLITTKEAAKNKASKSVGFNVTGYDKNEESIEVSGKSGGKIQVTLPENAEHQPLYIVNGKEVETIENISPDDVAAVSVMKNATATTLYGKKGENGVVLITTQAGAKNKLDFGGKSPLVFVDGVKSDKDLNDIDPDDIKSISVLKDASVLANYGAEAKDGVILITTKLSGVDSQNVLPVALNGKLTSLTLMEVDRDLIKNIKKIAPEKATKKYGEKGKNGVFEVTSRKVYTEQVDVKSTAELEAEKETITTELELRKFIAKTIKYPKKAMDFNYEGIVQLFVKINNDGTIYSVSDENTNNSIYIDEVVVVGYKPNENEIVIANEIPNAPVLFGKEVRTVINQLPKLEVSEYQGKTIAITVKFVLQDK